MGRLDNKVAIITGGARGMGASHAKVFIEEGAKVVITDILEEEGQKTADQLGENALFVKHDVTNQKEWETVVKKAEEAFGPIAILVNNAGILPFIDIEDQSEESFRKVLDINLIGTFLGMKAVLPSMKKIEQGSIINVSSINGLRGQAGSAAYDASKFAVRGLTKSAAQEFAGYGIRVNSIHPGDVATSMSEVEGMEEDAKKFATRIPMNRPARPEEVSKLVLFLASEDSSYSTGSEFVVDGGVTSSNY